MFRAPAWPARIVVTPTTKEPPSMLNVATESAASAPIPPIEPADVAVIDTRYADYKIIRRNGAVVGFAPNKIAIAVTKAFIAVQGGQAAASARIRELVESITGQVTAALMRRNPNGGTFHIEDIQDQVELALMRSGEHEVARAYVLYREKRAQDRAAQKAAGVPEATLHVLEDGQKKPLDTARLAGLLADACTGLGDNVKAEPIMQTVLRDLYDGVPMAEVEKALVLAARSMIEQDPAYSFVTARLLLNSIRHEVLGEAVTQAQMGQRYAEYFPAFIKKGIAAELLDEKLGQFALARLAAVLDAGRDYQFGYLGLQTLYDRYFLHIEESRIELPQAFFMRVAMGLAINEIDREARAIEFYQVLSSFDFMSSTPTLFNAGTRHSQLSSCYLTTVTDDLDGIYQAIKENAMLQKYAGGLGNDWTPIRAMGSRIKGTNGKSQGVVPFLKVVNDTAVAVNQGGKRKGAVCAYLETWHIDIHDFLELRKNTGADRRRTHDMNTANWIPDLFMQRVCEDREWTLFSPDEVPELHELVGAAFREKYQEYEARAERGELKVWKRVSAVALWRRLLGQLFETGHPWITFKDPCNLRYTNQHVGVVHSSNLCTEITLHSSDSEIAVCNLGSINLAAHVGEAGLDIVIDYNYYAVPQARNSILRHRPVGLGLMGFQDALYRLGLGYDTPAAVEFADRSMETIAYYAIAASTLLAEENGHNTTFEGSLWSRGILPIDSLALLKRERGDDLQVDERRTFDCDSLRERVQRVGMRTGNCLAIAPPAPISNFCGVGQSIAPPYQNLFVKSNLSGEFCVINPHLVQDLKALGLWDEVMLNDLKYFDGSIQAIDRIPAALKRKYATAFEVDPRALIEAASRRQKWLDQAQSLNLYLAAPSGPLLDELYRLAWRSGLKTTYYLRTLGATHVEKAGAEARARTAADDDGAREQAKQCSVLDPGCEACQ